MRTEKFNMNRYLKDDSVGDLLVYHWTAGAVPPPYHDEYAIRISGEIGMLEYWPDYPGEGVESQQYRFVVEPGKLAELKAGINNISGRDWQQNDPPRIGGEQEWLSIGAGAQIPADLVPEDVLAAGEIFVQMRDLVPAEVWKKIMKE
jgi:hypothetical protein